jgi:hypothetical protein
VCPDGKFKFQGAPRENGVDYYPTDIPLGKCISQSECPYKPSGFGFTEMDSCKLGCPSGKTYIDGTEFYYPPVGTITYGVSGGSAPAGCYTDINEKKQKAIDDFNTRNAQGQLTAWQNRAALKVCPAGQEGALDPSITPVQGSWRDVICRPCSDNSYKDTNMAGSCTPCPLGGSTGKTGSTTSTDCRTCPSGQVWNLNTNSCKCFGSLQIFNSDKTACVDCPTGKKPNAAGTACEAICPAGKTFQGWSGCQPCPVNTYQNGNACEDCPDGGTSSAGSTTCTPPQFPGFRIVYKNYTFNDVPATELDNSQTPSKASWSSGALYGGEIPSSMPNTCKNINVPPLCNYIVSSTFNNTYKTFETLQNTDVGQRKLVESAQTVIYKKVPKTFPGFKLIFHNSTDNEVPVNGLGTSGTTSTQIGGYNCPAYYSSIDTTPLSDLCKNDPSCQYLVHDRLYRLIKTYTNLNDSDFGDNKLLSSRQVSIYKKI